MFFFIGNDRPVFAAALVDASYLITDICMALVVVFVGLRAHVTRVATVAHKHHLVESMAWFCMGAKTASFGGGVRQGTFAEAAVVFLSVDQHRWPANLSRYVSIMAV